MKVLRDGLVLASTLALTVRPGAAWQMDSSCDKYADFVNQGMEGAFRMAEAAIHSLDSQAYHDQALFRHLFGEIEGRNRDDIRAGYENVLKLRERNSNLGNGDVKIFCDLSRFEKRSNGEYYNTVSKKIAEPEDVAQCNVIGGSVPPALAWTEFEMPPIGTPAEIQLCPWFAGWANLRGFKTFKDASVSAWLARFAIPASFELGVFTEVDVYSLLDKVLLHEMTHLFVTHHSTDNEVDGSLAYGWKKATELARQGPPNGIKYRGAGYNADTLALFGSVALMHEHPERPRTADESGQLISLNL